MKYFALFLYQFCWWVYYFFSFFLFPLFPHGPDTFINVWTPSAVLFSGSVDSFFMTTTLGGAWLPDQVVCSCPAASAASIAACRSALPAQPLHLLCRQMCSSACWAAELEAEWTEVGNVCIQLRQSMILFSQVYCTDTLINTGRVSILLFLLC